MIPAHGGRLINRLATGAERDALLARAKAAPRLKLNARETSDFEMIAVGAMSPLEGFMGSEDWKNVVAKHRLANGVLWAMPVTLGNKGLGALKPGQDIALEDESGHLLGLLELAERFSPDKAAEAQGCLGTTDKTHPGVQYLVTAGEDVVGVLDVADLAAFLEPRRRLRSR